MKDKTLQTGDLYSISEMPHEEAIEYIKDNPEKIHALMVLIAHNIVDGWIKRYERTVQ